MYLKFYISTPPRASIINPIQRFALRVAMCRHEQAQRIKTKGSMKKTKSSAITNLRQKLPIRDAPDLRTYAERYAAGKALRQICPRQAHAGWKAPAGRPDAVDLVLQAEKGTHGPNCCPYAMAGWYDPRLRFSVARPSQWPPTCRPRRRAGSASRFAETPISAISAASPPRREEYFSPSTTWTKLFPRRGSGDVKRLGASFAVACRDSSLSDGVAKDSIMACVGAYRTSMAEFSELKTLELWHQAIWGSELLATIRDSAMRKQAVKRVDRGTFKKCC